MGTVITSTYYVNNGEILDTPDIQGNGRVYVNAGGSATNAIIHGGGVELVLAGGTDMDANVSSGGTMSVNTGRSFRAHVYNSGSLSGVGATIYSAVVGNGGSMALSGYVHQTSGLVSRGHVESTVVEAGGVMTLEKFAACSKTTISGGTLLASSGTEAYGVTTTDGYILVDTASAYNVTMSGGSMLVRGNGVLDPGLVENLTQRSGIVWVEAGGVVSNADIINGTVRVYKGGHLEGSVVRESGTVYLDGGEQHGGTVHGNETIREDGTAYNVNFGKRVDVQGKAINCNLGCGSAVISSGGFFSGTANVSSGSFGEFIVLSGGTAKVNKVTGWANAIISGGSMDVSAGKIEWVYLKDLGGTFNLGANASTGSANVVNGVMNVEGVLRNPGVSAGGSVHIAEGGVITGKFEIANGAIVTADAGATVDFDISGVSAGIGPRLSSLSLVSGTPDYSLTVGENQAVGTYKLAGGAAGFSKTLTVKNSAGTELGTIAVDGDVVGYSGKVFGLKLTDDTLSVLVVNGSSENVFMGTVTNGTKEITSGMTALGATVNEEGLLSILSKGKASNTVVNFGGEMVVSTGGKVQGVTIEKGGSVSILEDVMAQNVVVNGGLLHLDTYGWAEHLSSGYTVSSNTIVRNGGEVIVEGSAHLVGAYVSEGGRVSVMKDGEFSAGKVNDGEIYAFNGALVSRVNLEDGGILNVESGGIVRHINVSAGGVITGVLREASELTFYGGTLDLDISNAAPESEFLVDEQSYANIDMLISEKIYYLCTLTVGENQAKGVYQLIEGASGFDQTITVVNTSGDELGTLSVGSSVAIGNDLYTLSQTAGDYSLLVTIEDNPEPTPPTPTPAFIAKSDVDGNGISDVLFQYTGGLGQIGFWMNGTNEWRSTNATHPVDTWEVLGAYDMDSNGKADSVLVGNVEVGGIKGAFIGYYTDAFDTDENWVNISYLTNNEGYVWKNKVGNLTGNDGKNSIVWHSTELGALGAWTDGTDSWVSLGAGYDSNWTLVGCGDFTGTGKDTVVMSYMDGAKYYTVDLNSTAAELATSDAGWAVRAIGDFSGDGKDDIVAFHKETGLVAMWGDGDSAKWSQLGQLDAKDWFVVGAGDYNNDQKDDLLVRQKSTGMLGYYTSGDLSQWNVLGYGVDMDWTVIA